MSLYLYDGSFEGLLTVVYRCFERKSYPSSILPVTQAQLNLLEPCEKIDSDENLARRVLMGVNRKSDDRGGKLIYRMFLGEQTSGEMEIFRLIKTLMENGPAALGNFADPAVERAMKLDKMISREVHRMHAFVRFEKINGLYFAAINPAFNVLPLIEEHFVKRYADQQWVILDAMRHYALYYDLNESHFVPADHPVVDAVVADVDSDGHHYEELWQSYFDAVNIKERKNIKLHLRHMPKRYWGYLTEKSGASAKNRMKVGGRTS